MQRLLAAGVETDDPDPGFFISSIAAGSPPTSAMGTCSTAPAADFVTVGVTWTARCRGNNSPVTPRTRRCG
ncbi:MAG: hypothetical protein V9G12_19885 [Microthrixaceae bacterium]